MCLEVTVTSFHPPRLCRIAVFSLKLTFLSVINIILEAIIFAISISFSLSSVTLGLHLWTSLLAFYRSQYIHPRIILVIVNVDTDVKNWTAIDMQGIWSATQDGDGLGSDGAAQGSAGFDSGSSKTTSMLLKRLHGPANAPRLKLSSRARRGRERLKGVSICCNTRATTHLSKLRPEVGAIAHELMRDVLTTAK